MRTRTVGALAPGSVIGLLALPLVLLVADAQAAPDITRVLGPVKDGLPATVEGRGFGQKVPAAPLRYDNFENGTIGQPLTSQASGGWSTWNVGGGVGPIYNGDRTRVPGEKVVLQDYSIGYNKGIALWDIDARHFYMSGWCYRDDYAGNAMTCNNQKLWGNFGHLENEVYAPQSRLDTYWSNGSGHIYSSAQDGSTTQNVWVGSLPYLNQWFRMERFMHQGTPGGSDGFTWARANLQEVARAPASGTGMLVEAGDAEYNYWVLGHFFRKEDGANLRVYWGELYVDTTLARVEIGDAMNWDDCTHREIQIPSAWSDGAVTFTVNQGTFPIGSQVFVFVVDETGAPSLGAPVTLAVADGPGVPGTPYRTD
jgi:hypothetical protein